MKTILLSALTSRDLPRPTALRLAGCCPWDLQQALRHYEIALRRELRLSPAANSLVVARRRIAIARRNVAYLLPFFA
jgi:hypothetical protein